jgi:hypothetical protein
MSSNSDGKTFNTDISADPSQFVQGMNIAAKAAQGAADSIKGQVEKIGAAFKAVQAPLLALSALVAGGAFFKDAIASANKLNGEALGLSKALGITGEEAATLRTALGDIGSDTDTYVDAFRKFARQIKTNEDGLKDMGIQTRDSNGNLRDSNTLFREALAVVGTYRPGLDQTTAAMTLFGKSVEDVYALQKLNNGIIDEAKEKNEALGLTLTQEGVAASKAYKFAMNDVGDVLEAVKNLIGKAVMPIFTDMAQYFATTGPAVLEIFKGALMGLVTTFEILRATVKTVVAFIADELEGLTSAGGLVGESFSKLFSGDFSGAAKAAQAIRATFANTWNNVKQDASDAFSEAISRTADGMTRIYGKGTPVGAPAGGNNRMGEFGKDKSGGGDTSNAQFKLLQAQLEAQLSIIKQNDTEVEAVYKDAYDRGTISLKQYLDAKLQLQLAANDREIEIKKAEIADLNTKAADPNIKDRERLTLQTTAVKLAAELNVLEAKRTAEIADSAREYQTLTDAQTKQLAGIAISNAQASAQSGIAMKRSQLDEDIALRKVSAAQALAIDKQLADDEFAIALKAANDRAALLTANDVVGKAQINAEIEQLEEQHAQKMLDIDKQTAVMGAQYQTQAIDGIKDAFGSLYTDISNHQKSLKDILLDFVNSVTASITKAMSNQFVEGFLGSGSQGGGVLGSVLGAIGLGGGGVHLATGTNYVPYDGMQATLHKGEAVVPAKYNPAAGGRGGVPLVLHQHFPNGTDTRTMNQAALQAGAALQRAQRRNG